MRPIVDTGGTTYYETGKFLAKLLYPLTVNDYALKDSFDTAQKVKDIPQHLFDEGYSFVSFDVESLFTNVPLKRTIAVIINAIYNKKLLPEGKHSKLSKRSLRKLIKDTCTLTTFLSNGVYYDQIDGVSMGSVLGPVLTIPYAILNMIIYKSQLFST